MPGLPACNWAVHAATLCLVLMVLVGADAPAVENKQDKHMTDIYGLDKNGELSYAKTYRQNPLLSQYWAYNGYFGQSNYNETSEMRSFMLKWMIGFCGAIILVLTSGIVYSSRQDIKKLFVNCGRSLQGIWAERKVQDRLAILKDVDDDQSSSDTRIKVDRVVYRAAPSNARDSSGGKTPQYTAVPSSPAMTETPPPVAKNGQLPVAVTETPPPVTKNGPLPVPEPVSGEA